MPAMPHQQFLTKIQQGRREIKLRKFQNHDTKNLVEHFLTITSRASSYHCAIRTYSKTHFPRATLDWNKLKDNVCARHMWLMFEQLSVSMTNIM